MLKNRGMQIVSLSLVTFNNPISQLTSLFESISESSQKIEAYIIDNSSNLEIEKLTNDYGFKYINPGENLGFGKAHNLGINQAVKLKSDFHIIVNPDITFNEDTIANLSEVLKQDEKIGLLMPKVVYPNGSFQYLCKNLPSPFILFIRRFIPMKKFKDQINNNYELRNLNYNLEQEVPTISGCFLIAPTNVLNEIGGFDERFFMYLEDVDLSRRVGLKYKVAYTPVATVVHEYAKESYQNKKLLFYHTISAIKYFNKWGWFIDEYRNQKNKRK